MKQNSKKLFFYSIKVKVALLCTCSIILAVAINAAYLINVCKDTITRNTEVTMQDLAASYSGNLSEVIRQISESANFMMSSKAISAYVDSEGTEGSEEIENLVTMFLRANTSHEDISLTDKNGIILYSSNSSLIGRDLSSLLRMLRRCAINRCLWRNLQVLSLPLFMYPNLEVFCRISQLQIIRQAMLL